MAKVKVEFIESYIHGIDDEDGGSYIWSDNHGELIRCKDCKWYDGTGYITVRCRKKARGLIYCTDDDYCSYGERKEQ